MTSDLGEKPVPEVEVPGAPTDKDFAIPMWKECTYCMKEERSCDCVNTSDGSDPYLQSLPLESAVHPESLNETVQEATTVKEADKKAPVLVSDNEYFNESFPGDYRQLLASMFHAATSLGQVHFNSF